MEQSLYTIDDPSSAIDKKSTQRVRPEVLNIVKKYRNAEEAVKTTPGSKQLDEVRRLILVDNKRKDEKLRQLDNMKKRMHRRVDEHVNFQRRIKEEERDKIHWLEEEYKRVRMENSSLAVEKRKLRMKIENMRREIYEMIENDEEKKKYFEEGIPIENKHETNYSDAYVFGKTNTHTIKHDDVKPKTVVWTQKVGRMGDYTSSPDVKVHDTYKPDHRKFEKIKDIEAAAALEAPTKETALAIQVKQPNSLHLLNRIKLKDQKAPDQPAFRNIFNGLHKPKGVGAPTSPKSMTSKTRSEIGFRSQDATPKRGKALTAFSNSRLNESHLIGSKGSYKSGGGGSPLDKADQVVAKFENMAREKFGDAYEETMEAVKQLDARMLKAEKAVKRRIKFKRQTAMILYNMGLCFKKAFYILKFYEGVAKKSEFLKPGASRLQMAIKRRMAAKAEEPQTEIEKMHDHICELVEEMSKVVRMITAPTHYSSDHQSEKALKRNDSESSTNSLGFTPTDLKDKNKGKAVGTEKELHDGGSSNFTTATSNMNQLVRFEPKHSKKRIFDVSFV